MKKTNKRILLCLGLILLLALMSVFAISCGEDETPPAPDEIYTVTVINGTGGGQFEKDDECVITATVPDGKAFAKWTVGGETVSTDETYTFTVTGDITVTAVVGAPYTLVVTGGKIGTSSEIEAQVVENENVTVTAKSTSAKTFLYWQAGESDTKIYDNPYTFKMTEDTTVKAFFDEIFLISVSDGLVYLSDKPEDAARSMRIDDGGECTIAANAAPSGQKFAYWYYLDDNRKEVKLSENTTFTFTVEQSRKIYAKYDFFFSLTVVNGYINGVAELSTSDIWANAEVTVMPVVPPNKGFAYWEIDGSKVSTEHDYTFKMTSDITVTAIFADYIQLNTPKNDTNQMFKYLGYGDNRNTTEFDREKNGDGSSKTVFVEGVDYILFYIYTSQSANFDDYVGTFKLVQTVRGANAEVQTMDGSRSIGVGSTPGNYYIDNTSKANFYGFFSAAIGAGYSDTQRYYFAAQLIAVEDTIYMDSDISAIGSSSIQQS